MQRTTQDHQIIIACDFTGIDWDQVAPMIEGHQGSVLSLKALELAVDQAAPANEAGKCTMCLQDFETGDRIWKMNPTPANANPKAVICWDCIQQADRTFSLDDDTDWVRHITPNKRWR